MDTYQQFWSFVEESLKPRRMKHTRGVVELAEDLLEHYPELEETVLIPTAILHDNAKNIPLERQEILAREFRENMHLIEEETPALWHAPAGAQRVLNHFTKTIEQEIIHGIANHPTGHPRMDQNLKAIVIADFAEKNRTHHEAKNVQNMIGDKSLNDLLEYVLRHKITYILDKGWAPHPWTLKVFSQL